MKGRTLALALSAVTLAGVSGCTRGYYVGLDQALETLYEVSLRFYDGTYKASNSGSYSYWLFDEPPTSSSSLEPLNQTTEVSSSSSSSFVPPVVPGENILVYERSDFSYSELFWHYIWVSFNEDESASYLERWYFVSSGFAYLLDVVATDMYDESTYDYVGSRIATEDLGSVNKDFKGIQDNFVSAVKENHRLARNSLSQGNAEYSHFFSQGDGDIRGSSYIEEAQNVGTRIDYHNYLPTMISFIYDGYENNKHAFTYGNYERTLPDDYEKFGVEPPDDTISEELF